MEYGIASHSKCDPFASYTFVSQCADLTTVPVFKIFFFFFFNITPNTLESVPHLSKITVYVQAGRKAGLTGGESRVPANSFDFVKWAFWLRRRAQLSARLYGSAFSRFPPELRELARGIEARRYVLGYSSHTGNNQRPREQRACNSQSSTILFTKRRKFIGSWPIQL